LVVFIICVMIFLWAYFQWRMSVAALIALIHDVVITIGVYAIFHIEVTPATVVGILTILGYSLYDTVVVFDKVKENTKDIEKQGRYTYADAANLAVNQTLVRSINTSVVALLPVGAILFVGVGILQAGTLKDLALALFVGIAVGTYSSIFVATPILVQLEQTDPKVKALNARVASRRGSTERMTNSAIDDTTEEATAEAAAGVGFAVSTGTRQQPKKKPRSQR
jgi:preprotein translocase subunit SecF